MNSHLWELNKIPLYSIPSLAKNEVFSAAVWLLNVTTNCQFGSRKTLLISPNRQTEEIGFIRNYYASRIIMQQMEIRLLAINDPYLNFSHILFVIKNIDESSRLLFIQVVCYVPGIVCIDDDFDNWLIVCMVTTRNCQKKREIQGKIYMSAATQSQYSIPLAPILYSCFHHPPYFSMDRSFKEYRWTAVLRPVLLIFVKNNLTADGAVFCNVVAFL